MQPIRVEHVERLQLRIHHLGMRHAEIPILAQFANDRRHSIICGKDLDGDIGRIVRVGHRGHPLTHRHVGNSN